MSDSASLEIALPVFNEARCLAGNVRRLVAFLETSISPRPWGIVIADNGSTDATREVAQQLAAELDCVRSEELEAAGRGRAIKAVWLKSRADLLSYMDIDLATDLSALPTVVDALLHRDHALAFGSRLCRGACVRRSWRREILSRFYSNLVRAAFDTKIADFQCGFKAIRREAAQALLPHVEDTGWFFDTELLLLAEARGWSLIEVPVRWAEPPGRKSTVRILETIRNDLQGVMRLR